KAPGRSTYSAYSSTTRLACSRSPTVRASSGNHVSKVSPNCFAKFSREEGKDGLQGQFLIQAEVLHRHRQGPRVVPQLHRRRPHRQLTTRPVLLVGLPACGRRGRVVVDLVGELLGAVRVVDLAEVGEDETGETLQDTFRGQFELVAPRFLPLLDLGLDVRFCQVLGPHAAGRLLAVPCSDRGLRRVPGDQVILVATFFVWC